MTVAQVNQLLVSIESRLCSLESSTDQRLVLSDLHKCVTELFKIAQADLVVLREKAKSFTDKIFAVASEDLLCSKEIRKIQTKIAEQESLIPHLEQEREKLIDPAAKAFVNLNCTSILNTDARLSDLIEKSNLQKEEIARICEDVADKVLGDLAKKYVGKKVYERDELLSQAIITDVSGLLETRIQDLEKEKSTLTRLSSQFFKVVGSDTFQIRQEATKLLVWIKTSVLLMEADQKLQDRRISIFKLKDPLQEEKDKLKTIRVQIRQVHSEKALLRRCVA